MAGPELRIVKGDASPMNRFKSFVVAHSVETNDDFETKRYGRYLLTDTTQIVPVDEVEFKMLTSEGADTFYIRLLRSISDYPAYEVWLDDNPKQPRFYDDEFHPRAEKEADSLVTKLSEAEQTGRLTELPE